MATKVQLFMTCLGENFFSHVLKDMVRVLERLGLQVEVPEGQACCGQPLFNSGFQSQTVGPARNWLKVFGPTDGYIVAPSGSCAEFARHRYPGLFAPGTWEHEAALETGNRTFEFTEFLTRVLGMTDAGSALGSAFPHKVTYHASCHILRGLGLRDEPKELLRSVRGLQLVPLDHEETCCGFGGIFSVLNPEVSGLMVTEKVRSIQASATEAVIVSEPGCLMNVAGGLRKVRSSIRPMHIIEVLAAQEQLG
jgi:L-lactate dehydrogenase complex protein LldE